MQAFSTYLRHMAIPSLAVFAHWRAPGRSATRIELASSISHYLIHTLRTIEGRKKPRPCTVILLRRKTREHTKVWKNSAWHHCTDAKHTVGFRAPLSHTLLFAESRTTADPILSALMRAAHRAFSSSVSHFAVSGRSVMRNHAATECQQDRSARVQPVMCIPYFRRAWSGRPPG